MIQDYDELMVFKDKLREALQWGYDNFTHNGCLYSISTAQDWIRASGG